MAATLSEAEFHRRLPVWVAFSDLYLDNETDPATYRSFARACRASGYPREELRSILFDELGPAFCGNLLSVAGEWAMFSDEEVARAMRKQLRWRWKFPLGHRRWLTEYTAGHWATIERWLNRPAKAPEPSPSDLPA